MFAVHYSYMYEIVRVYSIDELNGRRDFDNTIREVIIRATNTRDDYTAVIPITLDLINEADEGFMVVMRANEVRSNAEDIQNLNYTGNGVTLAVIRDDDRKCYMQQYSTDRAHELHSQSLIFNHVELTCKKLFQTGRDISLRYLHNVDCVVYSQQSLNSLLFFMDNLHKKLRTCICKQKATDGCRCGAEKERSCPASR